MPDGSVDPRARSRAMAAGMLPRRRGQASIERPFSVHPSGPVPLATTPGTSVFGSSRHVDRASGSLCQLSSSDVTRTAPTVALVSDRGKDRRPVARLSHMRPRRWLRESESDPTDSFACSVPGWDAGQAVDVIRIQDVGDDRPDRPGRVLQHISTAVPGRQSSSQQTRASSSLRAVGIGRADDHSASPEVDVDPRGGRRPTAADRPRRAPSYVSIDESSSAARTAERRPVAGRRMPPSMRPA